MGSLKTLERGSFSGANRSLAPHEAQVGYAGMKKPVTPKRSRVIERLFERRVLDSLLDQTGLDSLDGNPYALRAAIRQLDLDALKVRAELAFRNAGNVRTNASAFLALTFAVNDVALDGSFACDCADAGHEWNGLKGSRVKTRCALKQGIFSKKNKA